MHLETTLGIAHHFYSTVRRGDIQGTRESPRFSWRKQSTNLFLTQDSCTLEEGFQRNSEQKASLRKPGLLREEALDGRDTWQINIQLLFTSPPGPSDSTV